MISIHAPGWGATTWSLPLWEKIVDFNPRTRMGCDQEQIVPAFRIGISIHAPAWGATARSSTLPTKVKISIHAPAWGATAL